jgi:hypothetical protein
MLTVHAPSIIAVLFSVVCSRVMSSANRRSFEDSCRDESETALIKPRNRVGPKTLLCGTRDVIWRDELILLQTLTFIILPCKYDFNTFTTFTESWYRKDKHLNNFVWETVSKAFAMSKNMAATLTGLFAFSQVSKPRRT